MLREIVASLSDPLPFSYPKQFPVELFKHGEGIAPTTEMTGILSRSDNGR